MVCNLLLLGRGGTPFWSAHWMLFALRTVVARWGAYRHSTLRIGGCCSCRLLLLGRGGTPFWFAYWMLFASRSLVARRGAYRHSTLRIGGCCSCRLLLLGRGGTPFCSALWTLLALQSLVARLWHIAILFCALEVICFAVCCCSVVAERHFVLHIGHCLLRGLLLSGSGGTPFWSAHWTLFASQSLATRQSGARPACMNHKGLAKAWNIQFARTKSSRRWSA